MNKEERFTNEEISNLIEARLRKHELHRLIEKDLFWSDVQLYSIFTILGMVLGGLILFKLI